MAHSCVLLVASQRSWNARPSVAFQNQPLLAIKPTLLTTDFVVNRVMNAKFNFRNAKFNFRNAKLNFIMTEMAL